MAKALLSVTGEPLRLDKCANCCLFEWEQPSKAGLRHCKRCKVVQYCGALCQSEHWVLVHSKHCKKLASITSKARGNSSDSRLFPFDPLSASNVAYDTQEAMMDAMEMILSKASQLPDLSKPSTEVHRHQKELLKKMDQSMKELWWNKRIFPKEYIFSRCFGGNGFADIFRKTNEIPVTGMKRASKELWTTLHLIWGRMVEHRVVLYLEALKEGLDAVSDEFKTSVPLQKDVGIFPQVMEELIKAFSSTTFPSFRELLKIVCGGNLRQSCSFCFTSMTVVAVAGEVEGNITAGVPGVPTVFLWPYMPLVFNCGRVGCGLKSLGIYQAYRRFQYGVLATFSKSHKCDFCFKMTEKVHRYQFTKYQILT